MSQTDLMKEITVLQQRFMEEGLGNFSLREIIELGLSFSFPEEEAHRLASVISAKNHSLRSLFSHSASEVIDRGGDPRLALFMEFGKQFCRSLFCEKLNSRPVCKTSRDVLDYLCYDMGYLRKEIFRVVYLDQRFSVIDCKDIREGDVSSVAVNSRQIIDSTIRTGASALIFAHNHPSGSLEPSFHDRQLTRDMVLAGCVLKIKVLDHLIIGDNGYFSFAGEGLIEDYENAFLDLTLKHRHAYQKRSRVPA